MKSLSWKARCYIILLSALTASAVFLSIQALGIDSISWIIILVVAATIATVDAFPISRFGEKIEVTISNAIKFAVVLLYPVPLVIVSTFMGTLAGEIPVKRVWFKKIFNTAEMTLTWAFAAWVYLVLYDPKVNYFGSLGNVLALILSGLTAFVVNSTLVSLVISLAAQLPFRYVWIQNSRLAIWQELSTETLGIFLAVLWHFNPVTVVLAGVPLLVVRDSYKTANHLRRQTQDALRALVQVVDERDHHTHDHSEHVSNYARMVAESLGLSQDEIEVIASAALLHDLGKVGMADDILFNPKQLDPYERTRAEHHAETGAMLLSKFPLFDKGAALVRHHHEHYNGRGYPDGLNGEMIPLGSRIISVTDAYQAMTEDRPYRRALTQEDAIARLVEGSGTQFDPKVVQTFVQILQSKGKDESPIPAAVPKEAETGTG
jgi:putative nucleotidyltransferase with HDIG domain